MRELTQMELGKLLELLAEETTVCYTVIADVLTTIIMNEFMICLNDGSGVLGKRKED